ncbi:hypothetical protein PHYPO_G00055100 [Pangasianodon hypophthalmus]|uniref:Uncharacterized protein n=1 Tax=Pangasianodon hypophthalmus TaxID=310915 RepID=A0A5N5M672_PANHP|nr:hypothetical protein PHYPO_G00055100 [Pangasianodon hypophthalmus]
MRGHELVKKSQCFQHECSVAAAASVKTGTAAMTSAGQVARRGVQSGPRRAHKAPGGDFSKPLELT